MKKKTRQRTMNLGPARQRRLGLSRETVRTLTHDQLSRAVGGETVCDTTSFPTQTTKVTNRR